MSQMTQLQQQIKALQAENQALQTQRQGIITAVSSILGPDKEVRPRNSCVAWHSFVFAAFVDLSVPVSVAQSLSITLCHFL